MASHRPFRFGVQASTAADAQAWTDLARKVEGLGYSTLTMPDHFGDQLAPVPALMAAAASTTTLRVGALVWDNDYKHPIVLAKELATIDVLSGGRLEIGLARGGLQRTTRNPASRSIRTGCAPTVSRKVSLLIKGAMSGEPFSFAGEHYTITAYGCSRPVQAHAHRSSSAVAASGADHRAREADIVGINGTLAAGLVGAEALATMTAQAVDAKSKSCVPLPADGSTRSSSTFAFMVRATDDRQPRSMK
jgi:alkanesulfonate monooxygenase SsuD/methylene tetrahydromethanopterin reductase-like flavin-dependent oxidoreductase (luciferase family)